ncbi:MAG: hypothetical protein IJ400_03965 [Clostridia bacterium]|nr:hypothetical protein [Clostridia bacterium]
MKFSKIVASFIAVLMLIFLFSNCNKEMEYNGKDIVSLEYITVDFMGGAMSYRKMNLDSGEIYKKDYYPYDEGNSTEYQLIHRFDASKKQEIVNKFYNIGIFELDEKYRDDSVMDGGSWQLIIRYADGTEKSSKGINAGPSHLFTDCDYAFYDITGVAFWGKVRDR